MTLASSLAAFLQIGVGGFYTAAGFLVLRALAIDALLDRALRTIEGTRLAPLERLRQVYLGSGAMLTSLSGFCLLLGLNISPWIFIAGGLHQAGWLLIANRYFPPTERSEADGRQQSANALLIYLAVTAAVHIAASAGRLMPLAPGLGTFWPIAFALICLAAYAGWIFRSPSRRHLGSFDGGGDDDIPREVPPRRIGFDCRMWDWPLTDHETGRRIDPDRLLLPDELIMAINAYDREINDYLAARANNPDAPVRALGDPEPPPEPLYPDAETEARLDEEAARIIMGLYEVDGIDEVFWVKPE